MIGDGTKMIKSSKVIVMDVDGTLTMSLKPGQSYSDVEPCVAMRDKLIELKASGYWIILHTSRNMRTFDGNIGQIIKSTSPILIDWLDRNRIPYDELHFGKPWCGHDGYYVDDRAIRPREFLKHTAEEIEEILKRDSHIQ